MTTTNTATTTFATITAAFNEVVTPVTNQLIDTAVEIGKATVATVGLAAGTTLVLATATRLTVEGAAALTPSSKEEAEVLIATAMADLMKLMDTEEADAKEEVQAA